MQLNQPTHSEQEHRTAGLMARLMRGMGALTRSQKRLVMMAADATFFIIALWGAYALRLAQLWPERYLEAAVWLFVAAPILGVAMYGALGFYRTVVRYMGLHSAGLIATGALATAFVLWVGAYTADIDPFPRSVPINFALIAMLLVGGSRLAVRALYFGLMHTFLQQKAVLIYGAGGAGVQLYHALAQSRELQCLAFVDDDVSLQGSIVVGRKVYAPEALPELVDSLQVDSILLAMPSSSPSHRRMVLERLVDLPVHVQTIPPMHAIVSGEALSNLRELEVEDLLGRDVVPPMPELLTASITNKVVLVTGAGGSIGSELCRQILALQPQALVLLDISEYALYAIEQELREQMTHSAQPVALHPLIGSVADAARIERILQHYQVQTIYHAAAYKHVPLVEHNMLEGLRNNSFGTAVVARLALEHAVERFILVSTDKAVRPTNVMGASKRLAEIILQDLALQSRSTIFSMVRFGNVLGSSGSVVPKFRAQIQAGGPVTVTHPEMTRYFMTIPEAASLVIQAGSMAQGGDVFVLDMGEPVQILRLAKRMIRLMGFFEKTAENPTGSIEITYSGLRPGEKLYEELLIGDEVIGTAHPKILRALEESLDSTELQRILGKLQHAIDHNHCPQARELLHQAVKGYQPNSPIVDSLA